MYIKVWIEDKEGNKVELGRCLTDSIQRGLDLYQDDLDQYEIDHQAAANLCYEIIDD